MDDITEINNDNKLEISGNINIHSLSEITEYINFNLDTIILNYNNIVSCDLNVLPDNITNIEINNNSVEIEELVLNEKHDWESIILTNCNIKNINEINNIKCGNFDLRNNDIEKIILNNCKINKLNINKNMLDSIEFNNCDINEIDLSFNKLKNNINFPDNLSKLILNNNNFIELPDNLPDTLLILNLNDNEIEKIDYLPKNIYKLELSNNKLKTFDVNLLSDDIKYFDITYNLIKNNKIFKSVKASKLFYDTDRQ